MEILFLADNFPPEKNAQASRVYERACYWVQWGHQVTVITCAPNFPEGKVYPGYNNKWYQVETIHGIRVVRVGTFIAPNEGTYLRIIDFLSFMVTAFLAGLFQRRPDTIVATSPQFFAALGGWALSAVRRVPFVLELSDLWPDTIVAVGAIRSRFVIGLLEKLELFLYRRASRIVALTNAFRDNLIARGIPAAKIAFVINGVDLKLYGPRPRDPELGRAWGIEPKHFVVGYVGTHGMCQALSNVLATASQVNDSDIRFLFVGAGAERESLRQQAERRRLSNVIFVPAQSKDRMPAFWSLCDVALVHLKNAPLFRTVIPSKIFEAMGMGLPILLASPEGQASEILATTGAGLWVLPEDPVALAEGVMLLKHNSSLYERLKRNSRAAAPIYSRERQAREMLATIEQVCAGSPDRLVVSLD